MVCRTLVKGYNHGDEDEQLLETLHGVVRIASTTFGCGYDDEDTYHLQDKTGGTIAAKASTIKAHPAIYARLSDFARDRIEGDLLAA